MNNKSILTPEDMLKQVEFDTYTMVNDKKEANRIFERISSILDDMYAKQFKPSRVILSAKAFEVILTNSFYHYSCLNLDNVKIFGIPVSVDGSHDAKEVKILSDPITEYSRFMMSSKTC